MYVCICMYVYKYGLQEAQKKLKIKQRPLLQDVATRWGSTRASRASFLDHKDDNNDEVKVAGARVKAQNGGGQAQNDGGPAQNDGGQAQNDGGQHKMTGDTVWSSIYQYSIVECNTVQCSAAVVQFILLKPLKSNFLQFLEEA